MNEERDFVVSCVVEVRHSVIQVGISRIHISQTDTFNSIKLANMAFPVAYTVHAFIQKIH